MEFLLENILNLVGFIIGIIIGAFAYVGYKNTGSPVLFRLTIAFFAIGMGFGIIWKRLLKLYLRVLHNLGRWKIDIKQ